ncbi:MAG: SDR family NAD(P)-dependent oxidoreductase [Actinomycetota bacterium]
MQDLAGKTAVVTGGGSGIGRALVLALAREGCNTVVADIELDAAQAVAEEASAFGVRAITKRTDVADFASVTNLADAAFDEFGTVHILCNNAGVLILGTLGTAIPHDWSWVFSVNVMGVVHGVHAFLPRLIEQGQPAHIVNTASVAALGAGGIYGASKAAVVSISETLHEELGASGIGVSVLCPANVNSRILDAQRNRPENFGRKAFEPFGTEVTNFGFEPNHVAERAIEAIRNEDLYVFIVPESWKERMTTKTKDRMSDLLAAISKGGVPEQEV